MRQRMQRAQNSKKKNKGIALIEMLIVIGVIGLITAGIVALSTNVFSGLDETEVVKKINVVKGKVQKGYKSQGDYEDLDNNSPFVEDNDVQNPYGADFAVGAAMANAVDNAGAGIKIGGIPEDACINILTTLDADAFEYVALGTGAAGAQPTAWDETADDIATSGNVSDEDVVFRFGGADDAVNALDSVADVATACGTAAANNNAILLVGFY